MAREHPSIRHTLSKLKRLEKDQDLCFKQVRFRKTGNWIWVLRIHADAPTCGVDSSWDTGTVEYTKSIIAAEGSI